MKLAIALIFLALNYYVYEFLATDAVIPERTSFNRFPDQLGDWICSERETMDASIIETLGVTDFLLCTFEREEPSDWVNVYVGYHATQVREEGGGGGENSIHPPEHCLPGSGWDIIDLRVVDLDLPGLPDERGRAKRVIIARGEARQLAYFWYHSRGRIIARNHEVILYRMWDRATRNRTDGSLVRFTVPIIQGDVERAEAAFRDLASAITARLPAHVPL